MGLLIAIETKIQLAIKLNLIYEPAGYRLPMTWPFLGATVGATQLAQAGNPAAAHAAAAAAAQLTPGTPLVYAPRAAAAAAAAAQRRR